MKKKFVNILLILVTILSCSFLSACAGRYKNMEFSVQYAFVDEENNIGEWSDAGQTLSLNFGHDKDELKIDKDGNSNVVFRVTIKNVKAKYIDDIMITDSNSSSSKIVKQGDQFTLDISGAMQTTIRFYETKSGKQSTLRLNIFESLKSLTHNTDYKPALVVGQTVNLNNLVSVDGTRSVIKFEPAGTNQTKVNFKVAEIGYYDDDGVWHTTQDGNNLGSYIEIDDDNNLTVESAYPVGSPIIRIQATSDAHQVEDDTISTKFDLYVVDALQTAGNTFSPVIKEVGSASQSSLSEKTLYVNDEENHGDQTKVEVSFDINSIYLAAAGKKGVRTADGNYAKYKVYAYVDGTKVDLDNYVSLNGIMLQQTKISDTSIECQITADKNSYVQYKTNKIKFALGIVGLDFVGAEPEYSSELNITKRNVVTAITLNDLTSESFSVGKIYSTNAVESNDLSLRLDVSPGDSSTHSILISATENIALYDRYGRALTQMEQGVTENGKTYTYSVLNGETIRVNFKSKTANTENQSISFATIKKVDATDGYVYYTLNIQKVVTADKFELYEANPNDDKTSEDRVNKTMLVDAARTSSIYLKVVYSGDSLALDTINLTLPANSAFAFNNNTKSINLGDDFTNAGITRISQKTAVGGNENNAYYDIYRIPVQASQQASEAAFTVAASNGQNSLFDAQMLLKSVFVASSDDFEIKTEGQNIFDLTSKTSGAEEGETAQETLYAIINNPNIKSELHFGQTISNQFVQTTVANVKLTKTSQNSNAVSYTALGAFGKTNKYQIYGVQGDQIVAFAAEITYYANENGVITEKTATINFKVAVFNSVSDINLAFSSSSRSEIVYINANYPAAATTNLRYSATSANGIPSSSIEGYTATNVNQIKFSAYGRTDCVEFYVGGTKIENNDYLSGLSGEITVKLIKKPEGTPQYVSVTLTAYNFGNEMPISKTITINFGSYTPSSSIELSSADKLSDDETTLVNEDGNANLYLSFLNVADNNGEAKAKFKAQVTYANSNAIKYDDIDYTLYEIQLNDDGTPYLVNNKLSLLEVSKQRLTVSIDKTSNLVTISARKNLGGGRFVLRMFALDSYGYDETTKTNRYKNQIDVFVTISDGSVKAKYRIETSKDFENIKNNLSANYVLAKDISISDFTTLGNFSGVLIGKDFKLSTTESVSETLRSLTIEIGKQADSTDNAFFGVFARLTDQAEISDLVLNVSFKENIAIAQTQTSYAVYIGGLAGSIDKNVTIKNVTFNVDFTNLKFVSGNTLSSDIYLGGVAGEMAANLDVSTSNVTTKGKIQSSYNTSNKYLHIGGVAGKLTGSIKGGFTTLEDLTFKYDVGVNLVVENVDNTKSYVKIGGVAALAEQESKIENVILMGGIDLSGLSANGLLGGVAAEAKGATISGVMLLGVNLIADNQDNANLAVGGVLGSSESSKVENTKFISFKFEDMISMGIVFESGKAYGQISNKYGTVAGVIANSDAESEITATSVENYVKDTTLKDSTTRHFMLIGSTAYGISNLGKISQSYVSGNIQADTVYTTSKGTSQTDTYFIGRVEKLTKNETELSLTENATYSVIYDDTNLSIKKAGETVDISIYFTAEEKLADGENGYGYYSKNDPTSKITDKNYIVSADKPAYKKITFDKDKWETDWALGENWLLGESYNTLKIDEFNLYFPYLNGVYTIIPTDLTTDLNEDNIASIKSLYISDFTKNEDIDNIIEHKITETVIINYYNDVKNPLNNINLNTYYLANDDKNNIKGIVTLKKVPENAVGGVIYKILKGNNYASIVENEKIYFKGVTGGNDYILVKAYSPFNPDACDYFLIYTQIWYSDITISGSGVEKGAEANSYNLTVYKGLTNMELEIASENVKGDTVYKSLFDVDNIQDFITIDYTSNDENALTIAKGNIFNKFNLSTNDTIVNQTVKLTFSVKLNLTKYFGSDLYPQINKEDQCLTLATKTLEVSISETATDLVFDTDHLMGQSGDTFVINATLYTEYINNSQSDGVSDVKLEAITSNTVQFDESNHDTIIMTFEQTGDKTEYDRLIEQTKVVQFIPQLFDIKVTNTFNKNLKTYSYQISLSLKDEYNYRYLTSSISFNIKIYAKTNSSIDGGGAIVLQINPTTLSSGIVMNNYAASDATSWGNYTHLITSSQVETANITPGGLGGVLVVKLQPSYAYIKQATIKSSELFVPSINENVKVRFEQLVYHSGLGKYISITPSNNPTEDGMGIELKFVTSTSNGVDYTYDGTIYMHIVLDKKFSGLADEIRLTLDVTNADDTHIVKTKSLITDFLPGVNLSYDETLKTTAKIGEENVSGYLIQQFTTDNIVTLKIYGYQFNKDPMVNIKYLDGNGVGLGIGYEWKDTYKNLTPNEDGSYTIRLAINMKNNITQPFRVDVTLGLSQNMEEVSETASIVFFPTDYILDTENTKFDFGSTLSLAINQSRDFNFSFATHNKNLDSSNEIYARLLEGLNGENNSEKVSALKKQFSYVLDSTGTISYFNENSNYFDVFTTNYGSGEENQTYLRLTAKGNFDTKVNFKLNYGYVFNDKTNTFELKFGTNDTIMYPHVLNINFDMSFFTATTRQTAFAISSADQMFDANGNCILGEGQNYVLTNDITVELAKPITTAIGSLDGNNKIIKINDFVVDNSSEATGYYGLFATVSENTLLYNVVVDYSNFRATKNNQLVLAYENINDIVFGGLAAVNNGLIYNCDVVNTSAQTKEINLLVNDSQNTSITFGGLVGINNGTITNSRVGRSSFTKIIANDYSQTSSTLTFGGLNFVVGNRTIDAGQGFKSLIGGFVGVNNSDKAISSSYVVNTSLYTYSTNEESKIAGFVAENSGKIAYSYVKALESTVSSNNPFSTGAHVAAFADGNIAGFVYDNLSGGSITNSFANTELISKSAFMAGFVFRNNSGATVAQCYAACTFTNQNRDSGLQISPEQPFVGADTTGSLSNGVMENCYWYKDTTKQKFILVETDQPQATGLNATNFADSTNLVNFVFVLSNSKNDRDQGVWSYYDNQGKAVKLPELSLANNVSHSYRYETGTNETEDGVVSTYTYATKFNLGTKNNPQIISSVQEFNEVFTSGKKTENNNKTKFTGYVRFIQDIDFANDKTIIQTRRNFVLGGDATDDNVVSGSETSIDGNGMSISNIYLDVGEDSETSVGLFAEINRAYIKNLDLNFSQGAFSTANSIYSGGLAGKISDSVIVNISLDGVNTTIQGANLVGGLAGLIKGQSLIYGVASNLSVSTTMANTTKLYNSADMASGGDLYARTLSYAGGIAGVVDLENRSYANEGYNFSYLYINDNVASSSSLSIHADFAGGIAGYVGKNVKALRLSFSVAENNNIYGQNAAGGLFAASIGASVEASKVSAPDTEDEQFKYDSTFANYILNLGQDKNSLDKENIGNTSLITSYRFGGGLIGISVGSSIFSCYSKASFDAGVNIGGLIGVDVHSSNNFNYAVSYINFDSPTKMAKLETIGGLIGIAEDESTSKDYGQIFRSLEKTKGNQSFTFSTILVDDEKAAIVNNRDDIKIGYFIGEDKVISHTVSQSYIGTIGYTNFKSNSNNTIGTVTKEMSKLYDLTVPSVQLSTYNDIFSIWDAKYWNLDTHSRFFPLLTDERDENYEIIKDVNDMYKLKNNPSGSFKVIDDINMEKFVGSDNYVFDFEFSGVLVGEKPDGSTPVIFNLNVKTTNGENAGLFKSTNNARFRNLEFSWKENGVGYAGSDTNSGGKSIGIFSGFSHLDKNSNISAVNVSVGRTTVNNQGTSAKELFASNMTITGFAGLVADATGTNILNSGFSGAVTVRVNNSSASYIGGLIGTGKTEDNEVENTLGISSSAVGSLQNTSFDFTLVEKSQQSQTSGQLDIGLLAGSLYEAAISGNEIGNKSSNKAVTLTIKNETAKSLPSEPLNVSSLVAVASNCNIESNTVKSGITLNGDMSNTNAVDIAGLVAKYQLSSNNSGRTVTGNHADVKIESKISGVITRASIGIAEVATTNKVEMIQNVLIGSIDVVGNSYLGGALAYACNGSNVLLDQTFTNVDITASDLNAKKTFIGGLAGRVDGILLLSNNMNMGRITPIASENTAQYIIGGLAGKVTDSVNLIKTSYSFSLTSIFTNQLKGESIVETQTDDISRSIGALFGNVSAVYIGEGNSKASYDTSSDKSTLDADIYFSTDLALVPEDSGFGTNLAYSTLVSTNNNFYDQAIGNQVWAKTTSSSNQMPYISTLSAPLQAFGILNNGATQYTSGLVTNPKTSYDSSSTEKTYYLLGGSQKISVNEGVKGILIGNTTDTTGEIVWSINELTAGSAVSNVHLKYINTTAEALIGLNHGVIFNCSVGGTISSVKANSTPNERTGLIANTNTGLVSYSYVDADIKSQISIGAIVGGNSAGTISSCYFTGYIESTAGCAGIVLNSVAGDYVYNSYVAGVVQTSTSNSFAGVSQINGKNNFVDQYANPKDHNSLATGSNPQLVSTYSLMSNDIDLAGNWYTAINGKAFKLDSELFGYNYNYPVYNFNKFSISSSDGKLQAMSVVKNSRYTGRGNNEDYYFEIPHLGVLNSISGVIAADKGGNRYYKLTRDLDGKISEDKNISWAAIGSNGTGFAEGTFTGTFEGDYKTIQNLDNQGLFATISDSAIQNIKFAGSWNLSDSGLLGVNVQGSDKATTGVTISNIDLTGVSVSGENVALLFNSINSGTINLSSLKTFDKDTNTFATVSPTEVGNYGFIAATMTNGTVNVEDETLGVEFSGNVVDNSYIGGLVGQISGGVITSLSGGKTTLRLKPTNADTFGGFIGLVTKSTSTENSNPKISNFNLSIVSSSISAYKFGGYVGKVESGSIEFEGCALETDESADITIDFANGSGRYFGLLTAELNGEIIVDSFKAQKTYSIKPTTANNASDEELHGFGGLVGNIKTAGSLSVGNISDFHPTIKANNVYNLGGYVGKYDGGTINITTLNNTPIKLYGSKNVGGAIGYATVALSGNDEEASATGAFNFMSADTQFAELNMDFDAPIAAENWGGLVGKASAGISNAKNFNAISIGVSYALTTLTNVGGVVGLSNGVIDNCENHATITTIFNSSTQAFGDEFYNIYLAPNADNNPAKDISSVKVMNVGGIAGNASAAIKDCLNTAVISGYQNVGGIVGTTSSQVYGKFKKAGSEKAENGKKYFDKSEDGKYSYIDSTIVSETNVSTYYEGICTSSGTVYGVLNVGGAVGYLATSGSETKSAVVGVITNAQVYGNTNVGGLIGLAGTSEIVGNTVKAATKQDASGTTSEGSETTETTSNTQLEIKGILAHTYIQSTVNNKNVYNSYYVLPTSVGGLAGSTRAVDSSAVTAKYNDVSVSITTTTEGSTSTVGSTSTGSTPVNNGSNVISTISNYYYAKKAADIQGSDLCDLDFENDDAKLDFNSISTGFGGMFGTTSTHTVLASVKSENKVFNISTNNLDVTIDAPLGVNVGTYYGAYYAESTAEISETTDGNTQAVTILLPTLKNASSVSGAYNIGGAIGHYSSNQTGNLQFTFTLSQSINVQESGVGMYVGGVFGKFVGNIDKLSVEPEGLLTIYTDESYYIGGLVGRLEGNMYGAKGSGNEVVYSVSAENVSVNGDTSSNFGGLVGMLKVKQSDSPQDKGVIATAKGKHSYAFTVNIIENSNYYDGESVFNATKNDNDEIELYAQAYYINLDTFDISASQKTPTQNPLNNSTGWHTSYTGFRAIQRCILAKDNYQKSYNAVTGVSEDVKAGWDSITVVYDAANIQGVGTDDGTGNIIYTIYEEEPDSPKLYTKFGIGILFKDKDGNMVEPPYDDRNVILNGTNGGSDFTYLGKGKALSNVNINYSTHGKENKEVPNYGITSSYNNLYYGSVSYKGEDTPFRFAIIYDKDRKSASGSIFEVTGLATISTRQLTEVDQSITTAWIFGAIAVVGAIIGTVCLFIPGLQFVPGLIAVAAISVGATGTTISVVQLVHLYTIKAQADLSNSFYTYHMNQNMGYLSALNSREIKYMDTENGIENVSSSGYTNYDETIEKYYVKYSSVRPSNYYNELYCKFKFDDDSKVDKLTQIKNAGNSTIEIISQKEFKNSGAKFDKDASYAITDDYGYFLNYLYLDGYYWKCTISGKLEYQMPHYKMLTKLYDNISEKTVQCLNGMVYVYGQYQDENYSYTPNYGNKVTVDKNGVYSLEGQVISTNSLKVEESFNQEYYCVKTAYQFKELIEGYQKITGVYFAYKGNDDFKNSEGNETYKYATFTKTDDISELTQDIDYVNVSYILISYKKVEAKDNNYNLLVGGTYYKLENGKYTEFVSVDGEWPTDENGYIDVYEKVKTPTTGTYVISSIEDDKSSANFKDSTSLGELENTPNQIQLKITPYSVKNPYNTNKVQIDGIVKDNNLILIDQTRYQKEKEKYKDLEKICTVVGSFETDVKYYLWQGGYMVDDYPTSNGKVKTVYIALSSSETNDENNTIMLADSSGYEKKKASDIVADWDSYQERFYYDGKKFVKLNKYFKISDGKLMTKSSKNVVDNDTEIVTVKDAENVQPVTYYALKTDYNTYKDKCEFTTGARIVDIFKSDGAYLYTLNNGTYLINYDDSSLIKGFLYTKSFVMVDEGQIDYNYNMYLSNAKFKLYTRYKYTLNDGQSDIGNYIWKIYDGIQDSKLTASVIPNNDQTTIINNNVKTYFVERVMISLSGGYFSDTGDRKTSTKDNWLTKLEKVRVISDSCTSDNSPEHNHGQLSSNIGKIIVR